MSLSVCICMYGLTYTGSTYILVSRHCKFVMDGGIGCCTMAGGGSLFIIQFNSLRYASPLPAPPCVRRVVSHLL